MKNTFTLVFFIASTFGINAMEFSEKIFDDCFEEAVDEMEDTLDAGAPIDLATDWGNAAYAGCWCPGVGKGFEGCP